MTKSPPDSGWTDDNSSDPGITILDLLAYAAVSLAAVALITVWRRWGCRRRGNRNARL
jgi:hypothetical protein